MTLTITHPDSRARSMVIAMAAAVALIAVLAIGVTRLADSTSGGGSPAPTRVVDVPSAGPNQDIAPLWNSQGAPAATFSEASSGPNQDLAPAWTSGAGPQVGGPNQDLAPVWAD